MSTDFSALFGVSRESADLVGIAVNAVKAGYAIVPVAAGGKNPLCILTPAARKKADKAASERAKLAGHKGWMNVRHSNSGECGVKHAITDPNLAGRVFKRLLADNPDINIAIEVGKSRMLCVDADTSEQVAGFTKMWSEESGHPGLQFVQPTVLSPGKVKQNGEWTHKNGGHFHFQLPDDIEFDSATVSTALVLPGGAATYFKDRVLLVPPSVRPEGSYVLQSDPGLAPRWLIDKVIMHIEGFTERRKIHRDKISIDNDPIDVWSGQNTWASLLEEDGWSSAQKFDSCQCEIWTRPGEDWSSPKSATAHEPGCTQWDTESGHGFLHIWTDDAPQFLKDYTDATGSRSLSKLQYVAHRDHEGNYTAAKSALGLGAGIPSVDWASLMVAENPDNVGEAPSPMMRPDDAGWGDLAPEATPVKEGLRARMFSRSELAAIAPPSWIIRNWLTRNSLTRISGASRSFKTFIALDMACCVATGTPYHGDDVTRGKVLYVAGEGISGIKGRIKAWELANGVEVPDENFTVVAGAVLVKEPVEWAELWSVHREDKYDIIFLDTQARVTAGMEENSNSDMGEFVKRMDMIKNDVPCSFVTVHHTGHEAGSRGRGASSIFAAMDQEMLVERKENISKMIILKSKESSEDFVKSFEATAWTVGKDDLGEDVTSLSMTLVDTVARVGEELSPKVRDTMLKLIELSPDLTLSLRKLKEALAEAGFTTSTDTIGKAVKAIVAMREAEKREAELEEPWPIAGSDVQ